MDNVSNSSATRRPAAISAYVLCALITALVLALYAPALKFGYVWDDVSLFVENNLLRQGWASLRNLAMPILPDTTYFRPLVLLTFVAEFGLVDGDARISHGINVVIHACNVALVFALVWRVLDLLVRQRRAGINDWTRLAFAAILSLAYGSHPSLVESAAWVAGRFDLMVTLFGLLYIITACTRADGGWGVSSLALLFAALLCKEMAITLPLIAFLLRWYFGRPDRALLAQIHQDWRWTAANMGVCVLYLALRFSLMPSLVHVDPTILERASSVLSRAAFVFATLLFYLRIAAYPYDSVQPRHPIDFDQINAVWFGVSAVLALCLVVAATFCGIRRYRGGVTPWLIYPLSLLPVANILPLTIGRSIGENRFITLPFALLMLGVACIAATQQVRTRSRVAGLMSKGIIAVGLLLIVGNVAFVRIVLPSWASDYSLFRWTFQRHPDGPVAAKYLAAATNLGYQTGNKSLAETAFREIERARPRIMLPDSAGPGVASTLWLLEKKEEAFLQLAWTLSSPLVPMRDKFDAARLVTSYSQNEGWTAISADSLAALQSILNRISDKRDGAYVPLMESRQALLEDDADRSRQAFEQFSRMVPPDFAASEARINEGFRVMACKRGHVSPSARVCAGPVMVSSSRGMQQ